MIRSSSASMQRSKCSVPAWPQAGTVCVWSSDGHRPRAERAHHVGPAAHAGIENRRHGPGRIDDHRAGSPWPTAPVRLAAAMVRAPQAVHSGAGRPLAGDRLHILLRRRGQARPGRCGGKRGRWCNWPGTSLSAAGSSPAPNRAAIPVITLQAALSIGSPECPQLGPSPVAGGAFGPLLLESGPCDSDCQAVEDSIEVGALAGLRRLYRML